MRTFLASLVLVVALVPAASAAAQDQPGRAAFGTITALSADSLTVQPEHGAALTCAVPAEKQRAFAKLNLVVGQRVGIRCVEKRDGYVLVQIKLSPPPPRRDGGDGHGKPPVGVRLVTGTLTALSADSLTIKQQNGESVTCGIPPKQREAVAALGLEVGDHVLAGCRRDGGRWLLVGIKRA